MLLTLMTLLTNMGLILYVFTKCSWDHLKNRYLGMKRDFMVLISGFNVYGGC